MSKAEVKASSMSANMSLKQELLFLGVADVAAGCCGELAAESSGVVTAIGGVVEAAEA